MRIPKHNNKKKKRETKKALKVQRAHLIFIAHYDEGKAMRVFCMCVQVYNHRGKC